MRLRNIVSVTAISISLISSTQADTLDQTVARSFVKNFKANEARLQAISQEFETLPQPYMREPTGTGGFLSREKKTAADQVVLTFSWEKPVELDTVALFPLRLFMDEIYSDNLYWPGNIAIETNIDGETRILAQRLNSQAIIRQSLPEFIQFAPVSTDHLAIRCTSLQQHPHLGWYAAGFAEICIFSGHANLAPRATITHNGSRDGYYVLASAYLTDTQTPLGLPELISHTGPHDFLKVMVRGANVPARPYVLTFTYPEAVLVDSVRIDPAVEHAYGQSFPKRFSIELLDENGRVLQSDKKHETFTLRNPGLNPYLAYFPETLTTAIRLTFLEAEQPVPQANMAIAFSEITPMYKGSPRRGLTVSKGEGVRRGVPRQTGTPTEFIIFGSFPATCDGLTHLGHLLPLREWIEGLSRRQGLLEEQLTLRQNQQQTLSIVHNMLTWGSLGLLIVGIGSSLFFVVRNRIHSRQEMRLARVKIASDLHDDVGSNLGAIVLHVEKLQETNPAPAEENRLRSILRLTRESVFGLREVLRTTAPEVGRAQDIIAYMRELAGLLLGKTGFTFEADPSINKILQSNASLQKGLLLFYKEALHNAKTHAQCSQVYITFRWGNQTLVLNIKDNGSGIDEQTLKKPRTLRTLKQRADWLDAMLDIKTEPGKGTELALSIPIENPNRTR